MGGELLDDLVAFTTKKNLSGIEALSAIPGTVSACTCPKWVLIVRK